MTQKHLCAIFILLLPAVLVVGSGQAHAVIDDSQPTVVQKFHEKKNDLDTGKEKFKTDELMVKFREGVSEKRKNDLHKKHGSQKIKEFSDLRLHHVKLKKGKSVAEAIKEYMAEPAIEYAEPNFIYKVMAFPNDPRFGELWAMKNTGQSGGKINADINAPDAWDTIKGSSNVVVAVIDTGFDYTHADLAPNIWTNSGDTTWNGFTNALHGIDTVNYDGDPSDDHGHGTHVSGTIGAAGNNSLGVVGVNWNVNIMACKFLDSWGSGYLSNALTCLQYVKAMKDRGVSIVATSNSWGGGGYSQSLYDAIKAQPDILFIAAAGNDSSNNDAAVSYPSGYQLPNVIAVAATDDNDSLSSFSNYGNATVHVGAPGSNILSTLPAQNIWGITGGYGNLNGTSMATPHVSGLAALLKAQDPNRSAAALKSLILAGGESITALNGKTITGKRINAYGSVSCTDNRPLLLPLNAPKVVAIGTPVTIAAISINCAAAVGPVTVTTSVGEVTTLHDDGVAPDLNTGDGIYTGTWTPARDPEKLTFASPAGSVTISVSPLYVGHYLAEATINRPYSQFLTIVGARAPLSCSRVTGSLPPGLTLNALTGEISGTPTVAGVFNFTVQIADSWEQTATKAISLRVGDAVVIEQWAATYHGEYGASGTDVALDSDGNIIIFGRLGSLGSQGDGKYTLQKLDRNGAKIWAKTYQGGFMRRMVLDGANNIYLAGGTQMWGSGDSLLVKFDPSGNKLWEKTYDNGQLTDLAGGIAIDGSGNILLAGVGEGYSYSMYTQKTDPDGNVLWKKTFSRTLADYAYAVGVDGAGNVYTGGHSAVGLPYENGTYYLYDYTIHKYDPSGNLLWTRYYDTGAWYDFTEDIKVDASGNVYLVGNPDHAGYNAYVTLKYDTSGNLLWARQYKLESHQPAALALDNAGNVYVTGGSWHETATRDWDYVTLKYDRDGNLIWKKITDGGHYLSEYHGDYAYGIAADGAGGVYVTGASYSGEVYDMLTLRYAEITNQLAVTRNGSGLGSVTADSGALTWTGNNGTATYVTNTTVTLTAAAGNGSFFTSWSGCDSVTVANQCRVTMNVPKNVTATFTVWPFGNMPVKVSGVSFGTIGEGYAYSSGAAIMAQIMTFTENLQFNKAISVKLDGGKDGSFQDSDGFTTIQGSLNVSNGTVNINRIKFQ